MRLKEAMKGIWGSITHKNEVKTSGNKDYFMDQTLVGDSIYDTRQGITTKAEYSKKFSFVHFVFKYKILVPLTLIIAFLIRNYKPKEIRELYFNKNINAFQKAYDKTIIDFWQKFHENLRRGKHKPKRWLNGTWRANITTKIMHTLRDVYLMMIMNDNIYREWHNILMFNITLEMQKAHAKQKDNPRHLFYNSGIINEPAYFFISKFMNDGMIEIKQAIDDDEAKNLKKSIDSKNE